MMNIPRLYKENFIDKSDERRLLFKKLVEKYTINTGLYPGSYVHITPSFYIQDMTYIDSDKRCPKFFNDNNVLSYIKQEKEYPENPDITFIQKDFSQDLDIESESFDLLISLYAGFISQYCKKYLKKGGILMANNSHGDAPLAQIDNSFRLDCVIKRNGDRFNISETNLEEYFITRSGKPLNKKEIMKSMRGPGYKKTAYAYVFIKVK